MSLKRFKRNGRDVLLSLDDSVIEQHIDQYHNFYEHWMLEATKPIKGTALDLGSNFGNHAIFYSMFKQADQVIAVEPIWQNYMNLCRNITLNKCQNILPIYGGVGDQKGWMGWDKKGRWSQCQLVGDGNIPVFKVDDWNLQNVKLIKIDCEGMDDKVLNGAMDTITRCKPDLFIESFDDPIWIDNAIGHLGYKKIECYNPAPTYHYSVKP